MSDGLRLRWQLTPGVWTDVLDVVLDEGIRFWRGIQGNSPEDNVFTPGTLSFTLDNSFVNSAKRRGLYSPYDVVNCLAGFGKGTIVQVVYRRNGVDVPKWTGKLASINAAPGTASVSWTRCQAIGRCADLFRAKVRTIAPQLDKTEVQLLQAIIDAMPTEAQPPDPSYDAAVDTYTLALFDLEDGALGATAMKRVVDSARGFWFERGDGTPRYTNRVSRAIALSRFLYTDEHLNYETGLERPDNTEGKVFNRVRMATHDIKVGATNTEVLFSSDGRLEIPPGETIELWRDYQDQSNPDFKIGGMDFQDGVNYLAGTDYEFNDEEDGGGADVTADVVVTPSFFSTTCKLVIENTGAVTAYKQILQGRGRTVRDLGEVWAESFSPQDYGESPIEIDLRYQDDPIVARDQAAFTRASYQNIRTQIDAIEFLVNQSEPVIDEFVQTEIGNVIRVSETVTGTSRVAGYVQWIDVIVGSGDLITCRFGLAPRVEHELTQAETVAVDDALTVSTNGPESRIGFAEIGRSEVAA